VLPQTSPLWLRPRLAEVMVRRHRGSVRPRGGKKRALRVAVDIASSVEAIDRNIVIRPAVNVTYRPPMSPDMTVR
jgi:hypothetical protein